MNSYPQGFAEWRGLEPRAAAAALIERVGQMPADQRRAVVLRMPDEPTLARRFAEADRASELGGVPCLVKDLFDAAGEPTTAGSSFLAEVRPSGQRDGAFCAALRGAGVVLAGKTGMTEFAYGLTGQNLQNGDCWHPRFPDRTTGGSSSGSAAAVAAGIVPLATASDTGGSVRVPAAYCGLYGMRLTPQHAWISDAWPLSPSFDTPGWFTRTAEDMRTANRALLGEEGLAQRSPRGYFFEIGSVDPDVGAAVRAAALRLAAPAPPEIAEALRAGFAGSSTTYQVLGSVEAWEVHRPWFEQHKDRYDPAIRQRLERALSWTVRDIDQARAGLERTRRAWADFFEKHDFLVLPAAPFVAPTRAGFTQENRVRILDVTTPASLAGLPALTIPVPLASGLTAGLQVVAARGQHGLFAHFLPQLS